MELASVRGDVVYLLYHPASTPAEVGTHFAIRELPDRKEGVLVQIIEQQSLDFEGLLQGQIQAILEGQLARTETALNHEHGLNAVQTMKMAKAKIRKRLCGDEWSAWDGWIPSRAASFEVVGSEELISHVLPPGNFPLDFALFGDAAVAVDGYNLGLIAAIVGNKGGGKSHAAKILMHGMVQRGIPVFAFDVNEEYTCLPGAQALRPGGGWRMRLSETGYQPLLTLIETLFPLQPGSNSEGTLQVRLPRLFRERREECRRCRERFTMDLPFLLAANWGDNSFVADAIRDRLTKVADLDLLADEVEVAEVEDCPTLAAVFGAACEGQPVVFDLSDMPGAERDAVVKAILKVITRIAEKEKQKGTARYPFLFLDEAHTYLDDRAVENLLTRVRHIGVGSVFISNTPKKLPETVFRTLDTMVLLPMTHTDDIRAVSQNSFLDTDSVQALVTRLKRHHALIVGSATGGFPLVVRANDLPEGFPRSGVTRTPWDRFMN